MKVNQYRCPDVLGDNRYENGQLPVNSDQRWIADAFEAELQGLKLSEPPAMSTADRRLALCDMILTEVGGDDPEELAIRAEAEALWGLCFSPTDRGAIERYLIARRAHVDLVRAVLGQ
jgi:hypothetical protein